MFTLSIAISDSSFTPTISAIGLSIALQALRLLDFTQMSLNKLTTALPLRHQTQRSIIGPGLRRPHRQSTQSWGQGYIRHVCWIYSLICISMFWYDSTYNNKTNNYTERHWPTRPTTPLQLMMMMIIIVGLLITLIIRDRILGLYSLFIIKTLVKTLNHRTVSTPQNKVTNQFNCPHCWHCIQNILERHERFEYETIIFFASFFICYTNITILDFVWIRIPRG